MKMYFQKSVMLAAMLLALLPASAYDFEADGIYYNIASMSNLEVEVTYSKLSDYGYNQTPYSGVITIPSSVNYNNRTFTVVGIGNRAFGSSAIYLVNSSTEISGIELPSTIRYIDSYAFCKCKINSINLPSSLEKIGFSAFKNTDLSQVDIPASVKEIEEDAFYSSKISSVVIGKGVQKVGSQAFYNCMNLLEVFCLPEIKPDGLSSSSFSGAHSYLEIYVPSVDKYSLGKEYISFSKNKYDYSGQTHTIEWANNLKAYKCEIQEAECVTEVNAGEYTKTFSAKYSNGIDFTVDIPYTYNIAKAPMSLTVKDVQREYGDPNPAFNCTLEGFVSGENEQSLGTTPTFECEATQKSNVGNYRIIATLNAQNYEVTYKYGTLSILKAPISASVVNSTKIYGEPNPQFTMTYTGLKNGENAPSWTVAPVFKTIADKSSGIGEYEVKATGGESTNYSVTTYSPAVLTVTKRELTVKCLDCERLYGEDNPKFNVNYIGFVNNDSEVSLEKAPVVECAATKESNAGTYAITVSGGEAKNYSFNYQNGSLKINPLTVGFKDIYNSVTFNDMSISTNDRYFNFIPEIVGPFTDDDFLIELWVLDKDKKFDGMNKYAISIVGGDYAGDYVEFNSDMEMQAGKYIINLTSKGTNPNVTAYPSRAYVTVNSAPTNLEWETNSLTVEVGQKIDLGITYQANLWCEFITEYDPEVISVSSENAVDKDPHWYASGLKEGATTLYFSIECRKNSMGFYDFLDSRTVSQRIFVSPASGIENIGSDADNISVNVNDRRIEITNMPFNATAKVFNMQGTMVMSTTENIIDNLSPGFYIISVAGKSVKVKF